MVNFNNEIDEIILLNKNINYHLKQHGGSNKSKFNIVKDNYIHINWTIGITTFLIIYSLIKKMIYDKIIISNLDGKMNGGNIIIDSINNEINNTYDKFFYLYILPQMPYIMTYILIFNLVILVLVFLGGFVAEYGILIPCMGCSKSSKYFKCLPGTGNGSISCEIQKKTLHSFKTIINTINEISNSILNITNFIKKTILFVKNQIITIYSAVLKIFGLPAKFLEKMVKLIPYITLPGDVEIDFGNLLINSDHTGDACIFELDENGNLTNILREKHGTNEIFVDYFNIARRASELPEPFPKLDWDMSVGGNKSSKLSGGVKNKTLDSIDIKNNKSIEDSDFENKYNNMKIQEEDKNKKHSDYLKNLESDNHNNQNLHNTIKNTKNKINDLSIDIQKITTHLQDLEKPINERIIFKTLNNHSTVILKKKYITQLIVKKKLIIKYEQQLRNLENSWDKDKLYKILLRLITKIKFSPIAIVTGLINKTIYTINQVIKYSIVKPIELIVKNVIYLINLFLKTLIKILRENVLNHILEPLGKLLPKLKTIPIAIYRIYTLITEIGPYNLIFYGLFDVVNNLLGDIVPYIGILIISAIILTILIVCPYLGLLYQCSFIPTYGKDLLLSIISIIFHLNNKLINLSKEYLDSFNPIKNYYDFLDKILKDMKSYSDMINKLLEIIKNIISKIKL